MQKCGQWSNIEAEKQVIGSFCKEKNNSTKTAISKKITRKIIKK